MQAININQTHKLSFRYHLLIVLTFAITILVQVLILGERTQALHYDEDAYSQFASTLNTKGLEGIRLLIKKYPQDEFLSKAPSALRILYPWLGAISSKLLGIPAVQALRLISLFFWLGVIIISLIIYRSWFSLSIALPASLLMVISPLGIMLSQYALVDTAMAFIIIMSIFLFHRCCIHNRKSDPLILTVFLLAGFLTKESMFFLYPCLAAAWLYYRRNYGLSLSNRSLFAFLIAPLLYVLISSWVAGGLGDYIAHYRYFSKIAVNIPYNIKYQSGPWFRYALDFFLASPAVFLFALIGMISLLHDKDERINRNLANVYVLSAFIVFGSLPSLNVRNLLFLDVFLRALAVFGIFSISERIARPKYRHAVVLLLFILIVASGIAQIYKLVFLENIYDPITCNLYLGNGLH